MDKRRLGPCVTFFPQPTTLISTCDSNGEINLMAASWVTIASKTPPTIAVSLHRGRKSYANLKEQGGFVVNQMPTSLAVATDYCGIHSGHRVSKVQIPGLATEPASAVQAPLVSAAPLNLECRYQSEQQLGDYQLILAEIVEVHASAAAFGDDGHVDIRAFDPLIYLGGIREYWRLGEKVADAYTLGATLDVLTDGRKKG